MRFVRPRDLSVTFLPDGTLLVRAPTRGAAARAPSFAVELLAFCSQPRTLDELEARYGPVARRSAADLAASGLLVSPDEHDATPFFFANFAGLDVHRRMLADAPRLDAYARAIAAVVRPGMAVMDAGTGSGVLAVIAAKAGARVVYAVDASDLLDTAVEVFRASGVADRVRAVRGDFRTLELPEKVDVIVTETFGALGLAEGGVDDLAPCAARNLAPGGVIVPREMSLWLAPVSDPGALHAAIGPFAPHHGVDFSPLRALSWHRGTTVTSPPSLLHPGARVFAATFGGAAYGRGGAVLDRLEGGEWTGLLGWFDLDLADGVALSTAPGAPPTHWFQQLLPLEPLDVSAGDTLALDAVFAPAPDDRRGIEVKVDWRLGGRAGAGWWRAR